MANDAYLKLSGISGVATDSKHNHWIELTSFGFGISGPSSDLTRSDNTSSTEAPRPQPISISKKVDKTSPLLASASCDPSKVFPSATIALCGRSGSKIITVDVGGLPRYMQYELKSVWISGYSLTAGSGYPTESMTLGFLEIKWIYTDGNISGTWKHTENTVS